MLLFKDKNNIKKNTTNTHVNIDNKHQELMRKFNDNKTRKIELQKELQDLQNQLKNIETIPNQNISDEQLNQKFDIKERIIDIEREIANISTNEDPQLYYLNTGHILFQYYNMCNEPVLVQDVEKTSFVVDKSPLSKSILDFFKSDSDTQSIKSVTNCLNQKTLHQKPRKVLTKTEMMDKYMNYVDTRYISDKNKEDDIEICRKCNAQKYFINAEGIMICQKCGAQEYVLIDCDKPSYKEPPKEIAYFAYKRINHFNSWSGTAGVYCLMVWTIIKTWETFIYLNIPKFRISALTC
jgi:hypothetical protein